MTNKNKHLGSSLDDFLLEEGIRDAAKAEAATRVISIEVDMKKLPNIHPGEVLREEFLIPLGISQYRLAKEIGVPEPRISAICNGKRAITADTAVRLSRYFGTSAGFWLGLQADFDTEEIERSESESLSVIRKWSVKEPEVQYEEDLSRERSTEDSYPSQQSSKPDEEGDE